MIQKIRFQPIIVDTTIFINTPERAEKSGNPLPSGKFHTPPYWIFLFRRS